MHARLLMRSALSTKPKRAGATSGCLCGTVTPCTDGIFGVATWAWRQQRQRSTEPMQRAHTSGAFGVGKLTSARVTAHNRRDTCLTACFAGAILREHIAFALIQPPASSRLNPAPSSKDNAPPSTQCCVCNRPRRRSAARASERHAWCGGAQQPMKQVQKGCKLLWQMSGFDKSSCWCEEAQSHAGGS